VLRLTAQWLTIVCIIDDHRSGRRPGGFEIAYVIPPAPTPQKEPEPDEPKDERDEEELAKEAVRDLLLARTTKLIGKKEFTTAWERLAKEYPTHLPVVQAKLHHVDAEADRLLSLSEVVAAADAVLALINEDELAIFFGTRQVPGEEPAAQKKLQKEKEQQKNILIDALARKARALGDDKQWEQFLLAYAALQKWADVETTPYVHVALLHDRHYKTLGLSLQRLRKLQDADKAEKDKVTTDDKLAQLIAAALAELQWTHWAKHESQWARRRSPSSYRRF
jgi:tripeptidyl-peptidase-2